MQAQSQLITVNKSQLMYIRYYVALKYLKQHLKLVDIQKASYFVMCVKINVKLLTNLFNIYGV